MPQTQSSVILLEDDPSLSQAMERVLQASGFHTLAFRTLAALVENGAAGNAACLVFDASAAGANGPDDVRQQLHVSMRTPLIFISGYEESETGMPSQVPGNATFLAKPFTGRKLVEMVHRVLMPESPPGLAAVPG